MTLEDQIKQLVTDQVNEMIPAIEERLRQELIFKQVNQVIFNKKQLASRWGVSVSTITNYQKLGMPYNLSKTGSLEFDIRKVEAWKKQK